MHIIAVFVVLAILELLPRLCKRLFRSAPVVKPKSQSPLETQLAEARRALGELRGVEFIRKQREVQRLERECKIAQAAPASDEESKPAWWHEVIRER